MKKNLLETLWELLARDPRRLDALLRRFPDAEALFAHLERYGRDEPEDSLVKPKAIEWVEGKDLAEHPHRRRTYEGPYLFMRDDDRVVILCHEDNRVHKPFELDFKSAEIDSKYGRCGGVQEARESKEGRRGFCAKARREAAAETQAEGGRVMAGKVVRAQGIPSPTRRTACPRRDESSMRGPAR